MDRDMFFEDCGDHVEVDCHCVEPCDCEGPLEMTKVFVAPCEFPEDVEESPYVFPF